jgi:hypothetical protein
VGRHVLGLILRSKYKRSILLKGFFALIISVAWAKTHFSIKLDSPLIFAFLTLIYHIIAIIIFHLNTSICSLFVLFCIYKYRFYYSLESGNIDIAFPCFYFLFKNIQVTVFHVHKYRFPSSFLTISNLWLLSQPLSVVI